MRWKVRFLLGEMISWWRVIRDASNAVPQSGILHPEAFDFFQFHQRRGSSKCADSQEAIAISFCIPILAEKFCQKKLCKRLQTSADVWMRKRNEKELARDITSEGI